MQREELTEYLDQLLEAQRFSDYCPNGMQVEGRREVRRVLTGVTACQSLLERAVDENVDAILVHHGYFWKDETATLTGVKKKRIATLLQADINLYAYHLPLDAHPQLGNNAQLALKLGWQFQGNFGEQSLGWLGEPNAGASVGSIYEDLEKELHRAPLLIGESEKPVRKIAWCTGGAQSWFEQAIASGADAFITGEVSEPVVHLARETGVAYLAAGHHATERYGVMALAEHLHDNCVLDAFFADVDNPV